MADTRKRSIRRGQVWTSLVRIAVDARAEEHRARMMRAADEHAKALALAVEDEEICACKFYVLADEKSPPGMRSSCFDGDPHPRDLILACSDLEDAEAAVDRLRAIAHKVPPPRPGAERFEAPLVRDKATARAMERNKYEFAPAGTRAAHKRTGEGRDIAAAMARAGRTAARETAQKLRRVGFSPREIHLMLWEPLRAHREVPQFGKTVTVVSS